MATHASKSIQCPQAWQVAIVRMALVAATLAVYWPTFTFGYVDYDDGQYARDNPWVQQGLTFDGVAWAFGTFQASNWHPLTWLSLMLDVSVLGNNAPGHHIVNVALHTMNVLLLFTVLRQLAGTGALWRSALTAGMLAVHPIHVESVAWISERKDVLSLLFWLLAMQSHASYARRGGAWRMIRTIAMFALGLLAKPMVVTLPLILILLDIWPLGRIIGAGLSAAFWKRLGWLVIEKAPMFMLSAGAGLVTIAAQQIGVHSMGMLVPLSERIENAAVSYVQYLRLLIWPVDLAALYPNLARIGQDMWRTWQWGAAAAALVGATTLAVLALRRLPYLTIGWLWYLVALLPTIGIIQVGSQAMADRYAYIPFVGLYLAGAWTAASVAMSRPRGLRVACIMGCVAVLVTWGILAHRQVWTWRSSRTLFQQALAVTRDNWLMHVNMSDLLIVEGNRSGAIAEIQRALAIYPQCSWLRASLGLRLHQQNRWHEAEHELRRLVRDDPTYAPGHATLGALLVERSREREGLECLRRSVELDPSVPETRMVLARALLRLGDHENAQRQVDEAMRLQPDKAALWRAMLDSMQRDEIKQH
jgi:Flp pilus assembly protein TadD